MRNWKTNLTRLGRLALAAALAFAAAAQGAPERARADAGDAEADAVLGQEDMAGGLGNRGLLEPTAGTLHQPRGVAVDPISGRLYVADRTNNRVLSWPEAASFSNGDEADIVIGQPDFESAGANQGGLPGAATLNAPAGVVVLVDDDTPYLFVADTLNHRVLMYEDPVADQVADKVFGQPDFESNDPNEETPGADTLNTPTGVASDSDGNLFVADRINSRVLVYLDAISGDTDADHVFGQPDMTSNARNQGNGGAKPETLDFPFAVVVDPEGNVYVSDSQNHRVLLYFTPLSWLDFVADRVFGQCGSFFTNHHNQGRPGPAADTLNAPAGLALDSENNLVVADAANHRVLYYQNPVDPGNDIIADLVIGQADMTGGSENQGGGAPTALTLSQPNGLFLDNLDNLYVGDTENHRVLRYDAPAIVASGESTFCGQLFLPLVLTNE